MKTTSLSESVVRDGRGVVHCRPGGVPDRPPGPDVHRDTHAGVVHETQELPPAARLLLDEQQGIITTGQLLASGVSTRVLSRMSRQWIRLQSGIYCTRPPTWQSMLHAACLIGGPHSSIGSLSGAWLHGCTSRRPTEITVWQPATKASRPVVQSVDDSTWTLRFRSGLRSRRGTPARASVEECILDVANSHDEVTLVGVLTRALSQRRTTTRLVLARMHQRRRQRHRSLIEEICRDGDGLESALEWRYDMRVERAHGLPPRVRQVSLSRGSRSDGWYPQYGVLIELDGRNHEDWSRDMDRDNHFALQYAAVTLRYGWVDVDRRACQAAVQVATVLRQRGWTGSFQPCPQCP